MNESTKTALEKLSGWAEVRVSEMFKDEMFAARVFYGGAPVLLRCTGDDITWSVIHPSDYWAVLPEMEGWGGGR